MRFKWLEEQREVMAFVSGRTVVTTDGPVLLIGTRLLSPHLLLIDFSAKIVEIETQ